MPQYIPAGLSHRTIRQPLLVLQRTLDPAHPLYTTELAVGQGDFLRHLYSRMDDVIGQVMTESDPSTTVMVMSDHGFAPFRRQFNLNTWFLDNG